MFVFTVKMHQNYVPYDRLGPNEGIMVQFCPIYGQTLKPTVSNSLNFFLDWMEPILRFPSLNHIDLLYANKDTKIPFLN